MYKSAQGALGNGWGEAGLIISILFSHDCLDLLRSSSIHPRYSRSRSCCSNAFSTTPPPECGSPRVLSVTYTEVRPRLALSVASVSRSTPFYSWMSELAELAIVTALSTALQTTSMAILPMGKTLTHLRLSCFLSLISRATKG